MRLLVKNQKWCCGGAWTLGNPGKRGMDYININGFTLRVGCSGPDPAGDSRLQTENYRGIYGERGMV